MLEALQEIRSKVQNVIPIIPDLLVEVLERNTVFINELIRLQLQQGKRGDGQLITPTYSAAYAKKKGFTVPNLKVTGQFYSDIETEINREFIVSDANTKVKSFNLGQHLQKRYTEKILELNSESIAKLKEKVIPELIKRIYYEIYR